MAARLDAAMRHAKAVVGATDPRHSLGWLQRDEAAILRTRQRPTGQRSGLANKTDGPDPALRQAHGLIFGHLPEILTKQNRGRYRRWAGV